MRLAKITLCGFKSFADKTEIRFDEPIIGIVGPNGCGKSNIVDALKWVLGEQSAKSLRGGAMLDVIFNGSGNRRPSGVASVSLHFDNHDRTLPIDLDDVTVTRELYRDGASLYYMNGRRGRLKDIKELFLDTGVGTDAYSMIEQGKVSQMVEAKPQDRREIFEEAAGIARFKLRKKEAQRKLERTEQNLIVSRERLGDLESRLRSVKMQAGKARNYKEYSERLTSLRMQYSLAEYHKLSTELKQVQDDLEQADADRIAASRGLEDLERQVDDAQLEQQAIAQQQKQLEQKKFGLQSEKQQATQKEQFSRSTLEDVRKQISRDTDRIDELGKRAEGITQDLGEHQEEAEQLRLRQSETEGKLTAAQDEYRQIQHGLNEKRSALDDERNGISQLGRSLNRLQNEIHSIGVFEQNLASTRAKLDERASKVAEDLERLLTLRDQASEQLEEAKRLHAEQSEAHEREKSLASQLDEQQRDLTQRLADAKEERSGLVSRRNLLQEMQDKQEGLSDPVKAVLARRAAADEAQTDGDGEHGAGDFQFVRGLLAELIDTDTEHAQLVESALGDQQQALVVDHLGDLCDATRGGDLMDALAGRVTFQALDLDNPAEQQAYDSDAPLPVDLPRVIDRLQYPDWLKPVVDRLLGRTLVVDNLESAMMFRASLGSRYRFVTKGGEVLEADGRVIAGPVGGAAGMGLISRRSELADLNENISRLDEVITTDQSQLAELSDQASHIEHVLQELRQGINDANSLRIEVTSRLDSLQDQIGRLEKEQPVISAETEQIHTQLAEAEEKKTGHKAEAEKLEAESTAKQEAIDALEAEITSMSDGVEQRREAVTSSRIELGKITEQLTAAERQTRQLEIARADVERQRKNVEDHLAQQRSRIEELEHHAEQAKQTAERAAEQLEVVTTELETVTEKLIEAKASAEKTVKALDEIRTRVRTAEKQLNKVEVHKREVEVKLEAVVDRATEQLQIDIAEAYQDYEPEEIDWKATESEMKELRDKITRLGNVNLDAIDEQDTVEQQLEELGGQVKDIEEAEAQLRQLIEQINVDSRKRFEDTFNEIRENFAGQNGMFRKLFGGGRADVFFQPDENGNVDVLESGIEIQAKPPGKEPRSISLLSGGEKSMTAVALLMAIFKAKPSPFCVLDEVDAALDEANVERFINVIKGFLDTSHFIVVTHHKRTMQGCNVLYGITMQERGVSKRVQVAFDEVGADGTLDKTAVEQADRREEERRMLAEAKAEEDAKAQAEAAEAEAAEPAPEAESESQASEDDPGKVKAEVGAQPEAEIIAELDEQPAETAEAEAEAEAEVVAEAQSDIDAKADTDGKTDDDSNDDGDGSDSGGGSAGPKTLKKAARAESHTGSLRQRLAALLEGKETVEVDRHR